MRRPVDVPFAAPQWPAAVVEMWPISRIAPYDGNPKKHPPEQIEGLARDMLDDGVTMPILVDDAGIIIAGHARLQAAQRNGFAEYPVVVARGWTEERKRAVRIKDNARAQQGTWDRALLLTEMRSLRTDGYDIRSLGFGSQQLQQWGLELKPVVGADETPAVPAKATVKVGDIWLLGDHRLACGDSTDPAIWKSLFGRHRASMVFTDPPYGVSYQAGGFEIIKNDDKRRDALYSMLLKSFREMARYADRDAGFYIWHASATREDFAQALKAAGLEERQYLIWVKPAMALGRADFQWQHEPCFYAVKESGSPKFYGDRTASTVWHAALSTKRDTAVAIGTGVLLLDGAGNSMYVQAAPPKGKRLRQVRVGDGDNVFLSGAETATTVWQVGRDSGYEHPTQKPVELARRAIEYSSRTGEIVADGFLGSGTTLIGAEITGRRCFGIELDPRYADVIVQRWQRLTGRQAVLEATGEVYGAGRPKAPGARGTAPAAPAEPRGQKPQGATGIAQKRRGGTRDAAPPKKRTTEAPTG